MLREVCIALAAAAAAGTAGPGLAQTTTTKITPFYSACLGSGGQPGRFLPSGSDTLMLVSTLQPQTVTLAISPDAEAALSVLVMRKGGTNTPGNINLVAGQSVTLSATEITTKTNFRAGDYCLRTRAP